MTRMRSLLLLPCIGALMAAAPSEFTREELQALEAQRESAMRQLKALEAAEAESGQDVTELEQKLIAAALESRRREEKAAASELKLIDLETRLISARGALIQGNENLEDLMTSLAVSGRHRPPALVTSPNKANSAIRAAIVMSATAPVIKSQTTRLAKEIEDLKALEASVRREQARLADAEERLSAKQDEIEMLVATKRAQFESVSGEADQLRARAEKIAGEANTLRELLEALESAAPAAPGIKPEAQIQLVANRLDGSVRETARAVQRPSQALSNLKPLGQEALGGLMQPVSGMVSKSWGDSLPGGETAKGLYIQPRKNADVVAPVDGKIEYAGPFRSYGQLLIISTSDGYHILLSGMGRIHGTPGQTVRAGEPVGRMSDREIPPPELYLEVRREGVPMNPARWMTGG